MNKKYWVKYEKTEHAKYISHLDFVRTMNRILRRGNVPIAYSQGFNPHPCMSFALPLSVGITSETEFVELELAKEITPQQLLSLLNSATVPGLHFVAAGPIADKNTLKNIAWASYRAVCEAPVTPEQIEAFLAMPSILIDKRTKSGVKETDIRPMIHSLTADGAVLCMTLSAGNTVNLKPETVVAAMEKYIDGFASAYTGYHRVTIYNEAFVPLPAI